MSYQPATSIIPGLLYLGGGIEAQNYGWLKSEGIGAVVSCAEELGPAFPDSFECIDLRMPDNPVMDNWGPLTHKIDRGADFIASQINNNIPVYVHCLAGVNRSPTVLLHYLVKHYNLPHHVALGYVESRRNINIAPLYASILLSLSVTP